MRIVGCALQSQHIRRHVSRALAQSADVACDEQRSGMLRGFHVYTDLGGGSYEAAPRTISIADAVGAASAGTLRGWVGL